MTKLLTVRQRYEAKVDRLSTPAGCHLWIRPCVNRYPGFWDGTKVVRAHRWAYEQVHGPVPVELEIRHTCDNTTCQNLAHLLVGTHQDNMDDKALRRRGNNARGEAHGLAKLTDSQVSEIRAAEGVTNMFLARSYGVSNQLISRIRSRGIWKHL